MIFTYKGGNYFSVIDDKNNNNDNIRIPRYCAIIYNNVRYRLYLDNEWRDHMGNVLEKNIQLHKISIINPFDSLHLINPFPPFPFLNRPLPTIPFVPSLINPLINPLIPFRRSSMPILTNYQSDRFRERYLYYKQKYLDLKKEHNLI